jgi:hypothetical protein
MLLCISCENGDGSDAGKRMISIDYSELDAINAQYKYLLLSKKEVSDNDVDLTNLKNMLNEKYYDFDGNLMNLKELKSSIEINNTDAFLLLYALSYQSVVDIIELEDDKKNVTLKPLYFVSDSLRSNVYNILSNQSTWSFSNQNLENTSIIIPSTVSTLNFTNMVGETLLISSSSVADFISYSWNNITLTNSQIVNVQSTIKLQGEAHFEKCVFRTSSVNSFLFNANSVELSLTESIVDNIPYFMNGASTNFFVENVYVNYVGVLFEVNDASTITVNKAYIKNTDLICEIENARFDFNNVYAKDIASMLLSYKPLGVVKDSHIETNNSSVAIKIEYRSTLSFSDSILIQNSNIVSNYSGNDIVIESPVETNIVIDNSYINFGPNSFSSNVFDRFDTNNPDMGEVFMRNEKFALIPILF